MRIPIATLFASSLFFVLVGCGGSSSDDQPPSDSLETAPAAQVSEDMPSDPVDSLAQRQKESLGPALQRFLTGDSMATGDVKSVGTRDGAKTFSVLITSRNPEALREAGIPLTNVAGSTITARLTAEEILTAAAVEGTEAIKTDREIENDPPRPSDRPSSGASSGGQQPPAPSGGPSSPSGGPSSPSGGPSSPSGGPSPSEGPSSGSGP